MNEIIEWLIKVEETAWRMYEGAAKAFSGDKDFSEFLRRLSLDEKMHYEVMLKAGGYLVRRLEEHKDAPSIIALDAEARRSIEDPFNECAGRLEKGELGKKELLGYVARIEFSEANYLFLYVVNALKGRMGEFTPLVANIEKHKDSIEMFLEKEPGCAELLKSIRRLPKVADKKILVVDDKGANVNLLKAVLESVGTVEAANDGSTALSLVRRGGYSAIVTDIDMPLMNGIEFYKRAVEHLPGLKERFIFFTAVADDERMTFFRKNNVRYLRKPSPISEIRKTVREIAARP